MTATLACSFKAAYPSLDAARKAMRQTHRHRRCRKCQMGLRANVFVCPNAGCGLIHWGHR